MMMVMVIMKEVEEVEEVEKERRMYLSPQPNPRPRRGGSRPRG